MSSAPLDPGVHLDRLERLRRSMVEHRVDVVLVSVGRDMPYLIGYDAVPLERLTMLIVPIDGPASLVIPRLEAPRVHPVPSAFDIVAWNETDDPVRITADIVRRYRPATIAVGDQMWARFLVELLPLLPDVRYARAVDVIGSLRVRKDAAEIDALLAAGAAVDRIAAKLQAGDIPLIGRTEADVSAELSARILDEGHQITNFAIVAAGENAASPHHHAGERVIRADELVLFDFGGTMNGYCSDITRCVYLGTPPSEIAEAYEVLHAAQQAAVEAALVGTPCEDVDAAARNIIAAAGFGEYFIHRTGHGIGLDAHEDPYIVAGNGTHLAEGHAFSIEPGIYVPGRWGMRLEDIVVATRNGPMPMNSADHRLAAIPA